MELASRLTACFAILRIIIMGVCVKIFVMARFILSESIPSLIKLNIPEINLNSLLFQNVYNEENVSS